jgi:predicted ester cyclase
MLRVPRAARGHPAMASSELNKAAVRELFACASSGELDRLDAFVSPDYVLHDPSLPEEVRGVDGVRELVETYRGGIAGREVTIEHQIADGDYVATRYTCRGTHEGDIMALPATGGDVTLAGLVITRFRDGKVVEECEVADVFGLMQTSVLPYGRSTTSEQDACRAPALSYLTVTPKAERRLSPSSWAPPTSAPSGSR